MLCSTVVAHALVGVFSPLAQYAPGCEEQVSSVLLDAAHRNTRCVRFIYVNDFFWIKDTGASCSVWQFGVRHPLAQIRRFLSRFEE